MTALDRDLRYSLSPLTTRAVYALLFAARREIADVLMLGHDPVRVAARVLGVDRDEAAAELERLRAAGLVGEGLTLLAGARSRRGSASAANTASDSTLEAVRAALESYTGSRRGLARDLGCSEGALRAFASGRRSLGAELLASLAAYLEVRTNECVHEVRTNECVPNAVSTQQVGTQIGTQSLSPSDSLSSSPIASVSSDLSRAEEKSNGGEKAEGEGPGEGTKTAVRTIECAPTGTQNESLKSNEARTTKRARRKTERAAPVDLIPEEGTHARRVYEAITTDIALGPITRGPGDLARRLVALCDGTHVDPAAEVISAGAWQLRNGEWTDGAAALVRWVKRSTDKARAMPAAAPGVARVASAQTKIDYQGRRVVGPAGLPPGSAWDKTKEEHEAEEDALYRRAYEATQPKKGAMGR